MHSEANELFEANELSLDLSMMVAERARSSKMSDHELWLARRLSIFIRELQSYVAGRKTREQLQYGWLNLGPVLQDDVRNVANENPSLAAFVQRIEESCKPPK